MKRKYLSKQEFFDLNVGDVFFWEKRLNGKKARYSAVILEKRHIDPEVGRMYHIHNLKCLVSVQGVDGTKVRRVRLATTPYNLKSYHSHPRYFIYGS